MISSELLGRYDTMWRLSQQMLEAAKAGDWDRLVALEQARTAIVEELRQKDRISWQGVESAKKEKLIRAILAADTEIKTLTESWMGELQKTIGSIGVEKKVKKAYESF